MQQIDIAVDALAVTLEYEWIGSSMTGAQAPLIVFLHEGLGAAGQWGDWPHRLCTSLGWRGLLFSRYGYGASQARPAAEDGWPLDYMEREARENLPALLHALGIDAARDQLVLVGQSDGATIALLYAAAFPHSPRAVVVLAPHVFTESVARDRIGRLRTAHGAPARLADHLAALHEDPGGVFQGWSGRWVSPAFADWNVGSVIESIACPLLVIQGRQDQFGTMEQLDEIKRRVPHAELLVVENCRHVPHEEHADAVLHAVTDFLTAAAPQP